MKAPLTLTLSVRQPDGSWSTRTATGTRDEIDAALRLVAATCLPEWRAEVGEVCVGCFGTGQVFCYGIYGACSADCKSCLGTGRVCTVRTSGGRRLEVLV